MDSSHNLGGPPKQMRAMREAGLNHRGRHHGGQVERLHLVTWSMIQGRTSGITGNQSGDAAALGSRNNVQIRCSRYKKIDSWIFLSCRRKSLLGMVAVGSGPKRGSVADQVSSATSYKHALCSLSFSLLLSRMQ